MTLLLKLIPRPGAAGGCIIPSARPILSLNSGSHQDMYSINGAEGTAAIMWIEISIHMIAAVPSAPFIEYMSWWEPLFNERIGLADGMMHPPAAPGLGISFNNNVIDRYMSAQA